MEAGIIAAKAMHEYIMKKLASRNERQRYEPQSPHSLR
jgi:hypothetical protein